MQNNIITILHARNKLDDYLSKRIEIGYKSSTTTFDKENITMFLKSYSEDGIFDEMLIDEFLKTKYKDHKNHRRIMSVKNTLTTFLEFLLSGKPYKTKEKNNCLPDCLYSNIVNDFLVHECSTNKEYTINMKRLCLMKFINDIEQAGIDLKDISIDFVIDYCCNRTVEKTYYIKAFLLYLYKVSFIKYDLSYFIKINKRPVKIPSVYDENEIRSILNYYDQDNNISIRNKAIIALIVSTGLRSCDVAELKITNIDFDRHHITLSQKKNGVEISLYINPDVERLLRKHLKVNIFNDEYVFHAMCYPFNPINTGSIRYIVRKAIKDLGHFKSGKKAGPHSLRSSFATALVNDGFNYDLVEKALGHQNSDSLRFYVKTDIEKLRLCALAAIEPTGSFKEWLG